MAGLRVYKPLDLRNIEDNMIESVKKYYFVFEGRNTEKDESIANDSAPIRILEEARKMKEELIKDKEFNEEIDKFVIVFDRDSFKPVDTKKEEYIDFIKLATDDAILAVTSPCFELWLLLHYDNISVEFIRKKICENNIDTLEGIKKYKNYFRQNLKVSGKHTFTSKAFSLTAGINPKSNTDFTQLLENTDKAIEIEKDFILTRDIYEMTDKLGSNIGKLIEILRKDPRKNAD